MIEQIFPSSTTTATSRKVSTTSRQIVVCWGGRESGVGGPRGSRPRARGARPCFPSRRPAAWRKVCVIQAMPYAGKLAFGPKPRCKDTHARAHTHTPTHTRARAQQTSRCCFLRGVNRTSTTQPQRKRKKGNNKAPPADKSGPGPGLVFIVSGVIMRDRSPPRG